MQINHFGGELLINVDDFLGMDVIDVDGENVGKIDSMNFDEDIGQINEIIIKPNGILSREKETLKYSDIDKIKDVVLLNRQLKMEE